MLTQHKAINKASVIQPKKHHLQCVIGKKGLQDQAWYTSCYDINFKYDNRKSDGIENVKKKIIINALNDVGKKCDLKKL